MARERDKAVAGNALFFETLFAAETGVSDAKFTKCELKEEDKGSVYEIEFTSGSKKYEYKIDAADGSILSSRSHVNCR